MKEHTITITGDDLEMIYSTFKARRIRVCEWVTEAKKAGKQKDVERWDQLLESKEAVERKIRKQINA